MLFIFSAILNLKGDEHMQTKSFLLTMGAGIAVGMLGALMLPKNSEVYRFTKSAADTVKTEAEKVIDSLSEQ